jgi:hypothetical protein
VVRAKPHVTCASSLGGPSWFASVFVWNGHSVPSSCAISTAPIKYARVVCLRHCPSGFHEIYHLFILYLFNSLNADLNPTCHLLALLGGATIVDVSRLRVNDDLSLSWTVHLTECTGEPIKNEMGGVCGTRGEQERCIQGYGVETGGKETTWKT